jgi:hypothetical protein
MDGFVITFALMMQGLGNMGGQKTLGLEIFITKTWKSIIPLSGREDIVESLSAPPIG